MMKIGDGYTSIEELVNDTIITDRQWIDLGLMGLGEIIQKNIMDALKENILEHIKEFNGNFD